MQALSSAKDAPESGYETTLLARPEPSTNFITEDLVPSMDSTSKMSVHSSREVTSAEVRDMALKRWLKSSSAAISSDEAERRKIEELSYKILSLADPEEESKDEANDREIYKAVFTSVAAYQIRKLQRKLRNGRVKRDEEMVCYKDLGCFRDDGAFDYLDVLPSPPEEINTKFLLFTRKNPEAAQIFDPNNATSMQASNFDAESLTKVIVHGFGSSCHRVWVREMRAALLTMVDVNLICVDWENGATVPNYMRAASNTRLVGRQVGRMVESLMKATNTSLDKFHLIGFSLGAHVSGHAGKKLKFKRISGLDPAGPLFENFPPSVRLDSSDAEFVDVIHTNADSLIRGGLGAYQAMGHVDFYPNGGRMQKGCTNLFVGGVSDILWPTEGDGRSLCNHRRGYKYFVESIAPVCRFPAFVCTDYDAFMQGDCFPCAGCGNMGYYSDKAEGRGQLYLVTRDSEPFCANQYKVSLKHSGGPPLLSAVSTYGRIDVTFIGADGINETIPLTRMPDEELKAGSSTVRILVPHPAITGITSVQLLYTAYDGWLSSGSKRWAIDKVSIMDSFGNIQSFCKLGVTLESGVPFVARLQPTACTPRFTPWRTIPPARPGLNVTPSPNTRTNATSGITIIEHNTVISTQGSNVSVIVPESSNKQEAGGAIRPKEPSFHSHLPTSEVSVNMGGNVQTNPPQSSVVISFPGSREPPSENHSPPFASPASAPSASSTFSISLPSAPSGTVYKFVPPHGAPDVAHTNLHWTYNYDDYFDYNHHVVHLNSTEYKPKLPPTLVVTSMPLPEDFGQSSSETVLRVSGNETHNNGSNLRDGPAPNLYPASMTEGMEESGYSYDNEDLDFEITTTMEDLMPGVVLRPNNFNASRSRVVIKVNETPAKLWGLTSLHNKAPASYAINSKNVTSQEIISVNLSSINSSSPRLDSPSGSMQSEDTHSNSQSINSESTATNVAKSELADQKAQLDESPYQFGYILQNGDVTGQTLLMLNRHNVNGHSSDNPLAAYMRDFVNKSEFPNGNDSGLGASGILYNSLVDGEVPMNERARALFPGSSNTNNANLQTSKRTNVSREKMKKDDASTASKGNINVPSPEMMAAGDGDSSIRPSPPIDRYISHGHDSYHNGPHHNIKFQHKGNDSERMPILSVNLRPPAAPNGFKDHSSDRGEHTTNAPVLSTTSAPSYLARLTAYFPQLFADQLASFTKDSPITEAPTQAVTDEIRSNTTISGLESQSNLTERIKGGKLVANTESMGSENPSSTTTTTESWFPYSWSYFSGRRSSEETEDDSFVHSEDENRAILPTINVQSAKHAAVSQGEIISSYTTHELPHPMPDAPNKHFNPLISFSLPQNTHFQVTENVAPGSDGGQLGTGTSQRRTEPPLGRRRIRNHHRYNQKGGKSSPSFRLLPKSIKIPKDLPPNYPFYQLNPLTALPTRLVAPPPLPSEQVFHRNSGDKELASVTDSAYQASEISYPRVLVGDHRSNVAIVQSLDPHKVSNFSSDVELKSQTGLSEKRNVIDTKSSNGSDVQNDADSINAKPANSSESRKERKLEIYDKTSIMKVPVSHDVTKAGRISQLKDVPQPDADLVSFDYRHERPLSNLPLVGHPNAEIASSNNGVISQPDLAGDFVGYALDPNPHYTSSDRGVRPVNAPDQSQLWQQEHQFDTGAKNGDLKQPNYKSGISVIYDTAPKHFGAHGVNHNVGPSLPNIPETSSFSDSSALLDEFVFVDSSYASLLPSPALPEPLVNFYHGANSNVNAQPNSQYSESYISGPSLSYKSFLTSPSELTSSEYSARFPPTFKGSRDPATMNQNLPKELTMHERLLEPHHSLPSTPVPINDEFDDSFSFGGRSLSTEHYPRGLPQNIYKSSGDTPHRIYESNTDVSGDFSGHRSPPLPAVEAAAGNIRENGMHSGGLTASDYRDPLFREASSSHFLTFGNNDRASGDGRSFSSLTPQTSVVDHVNSQHTIDGRIVSRLRSIAFQGPSVSEFQNFASVQNPNLDAGARGRGGISIQLDPPIVG
ncbi:uncharacterized protein LOC108672111 [Hyalella azteca]|uniref:Uncharacterized protein LOC108672111 n=1 Tax=Hyalella azteca TaxID=294128 RepID=A0A8B7NNG9_HYAAZ|nr:uncharacterized protein LOC108672111 [Hyalella azteca]